ncbi:hypothetical protein [Hymenobacter psychrotolerans]|uniref:Uncharacterized protein n=1 Tax=Hymenobacter psychrotolerans DSM 18569 TaxID=1121959 RepID=A0A1M6XIH9_9BACT|nr:hypothetical protein [Hymenobacter psychrotolerans]SHL05726.1 hypothetical protein SAMN02746009_02051 [Hymenobacter psychrotolerans DSM 18569]
MAPSRPNGPSVNGHPASLSARPEDSVEVRLGFIRYEEKELVFEVEVNNSSTRPVLIAPETFYYTPLYSDAPDTVVSGAAAVLEPARVPALDPEARLQLLAKRLDKQANRAQGGGWLELVTSATHIAENVSTITKKETDQQVAEREQRHASDEAFLADQREQYAQQADVLYDQKQHMESVALRKTLLPARQYVTGQVHFPRSDGAHQLRMVVFFNERPVTFTFVQRPGVL